jgi:hypothetical protein
MLSYRHQDDLYFLISGKLYVKPKKAEAKIVIVLKSDAKVPTSLIVKYCKNAKSSVKRD